jgi:hypothetical protein
MGGKIDHVVLHPHASTVIRTVARRILADPENVTPSSEAARLSRAGEHSPADHLAVMYGKPAGGRPWQPTSLKKGAALVTRSGLDVSFTYPEVHSVRRLSVTQAGLHLAA